MDDSKTGRPPKATAKKSARGRRQNYAARLNTQAHKPLGQPEAAVKNSRGAEVRECVLHAALECFGAFGFESISTRAVTARAGLSHPLLLWRFAVVHLICVA